MTGLGAAAPATTPRGQKSASPLPSRAAHQATRGPRFEGMERVFGKAEDPPSGAAGSLVRRDRARPSVVRDFAPGHSVVVESRSRLVVRSARNVISGN